MTSTYTHSIPTETSAFAVGAPGRVTPPSLPPLPTVPTVPPVVQDAATRPAPPAVDRPRPGRGAHSTAKLGRTGTPTPPPRKERPGTLLILTPIAARPTYLSETPDDVDLSNAKKGALLLGLPLYEQGVNIARVLEAKDEGGLPLYPETAIMLPRRGQKTTGIWATLLGRCENQPGHKVVTTAQDGTRARNRWAEVARALEAIGWTELPGNNIRYGNGFEAFEWANGPRLWIVPPKASAFRGEAADDMFFDEAGELRPEVSEDLLAGALPLMDTRPQGQVIVAGTPSKTRAGLLWKSLASGRKGLSGIVDYSIRDDEASVTYSEDGAAQLNLDILRRVHPGIGTLTTEARMIQRFESMQLQQFEMEYLCRFPLDNMTGALDLQKWFDARVPDVERPDRVGIAFDCAVDSTCASIAYAWRDENGKAYIELVAHRPGTSWVPQQAHIAGTKRRGQSVGFDDIGANRDPAERLQKLRPQVPIMRYTMKDIMGAAQRLVTELHDENLAHFGQVDLDEAAKNIAWRQIAQSGRAFGMKASQGASISPIVAASLALWTFDRQPKRERVTIVA